MIGREMCKIFIVSAAVLVLLGLFFMFVPTGHGMLALTLWIIAAAILWFLLLLNVPAGKYYAASQVLIKLTVCAMVLFFIVFGITEYHIVSSARTDRDPQADYIIVLGAGVNGTVPSRSLADRLEVALWYLETYPDSVAILSGGQGEHEDITEAECMYRWLSQRGIEAERLIKEECATSTHENLLFSFDIITSRGDAQASVALLTSEYHLLRASLMAESMGWQVKNVAAPTSIITLRINHFIRESLGVWHFLVFGW